MKPLEAMAKDLFEDAYPDWTWDIAPQADRENYLRRAKLARDALADNVDRKMTDAFIYHLDPDILPSIAAAIRAAVEG